MSFLEELITEINKAKQPKKESKVNKFLEFEKQLRDLAKSKGLQPRTFLEQLAKSNPELAKNKIIIKLIGEQDVPQQKGRDAKPQVLTKRAMNTVKKGIKQAANKQRRRMDKDAVKEDGKDEFSKHVNPMGSDSVAMAKIKKSPGFYDMLVTFYTSAVLHDRDDEEVLPIMSSMFNMNVEEIKAVLRQYGNFTFGGSSPEDKFKANMGATGFLGKGKSRTLNSVYEDEHQDRGYAQMIIQQHPEEYKKFMQTGDLFDAPTIYEKLFAYFSSSDASEQMPYGTQKARDGDPYVWLTDKLDDLGLTEGNEFAQKVRQMKAAGAKKGTKFKTSDGEEHTLEDERYDSDSSGKFQITFSDEDMDANTEAQYLQVLKNLLKTYKDVDIARVDDVESYIMVRGLPEQKTEAVSDKKVDSFHTELDRLVHKYFGHSSDEKKEKVKEDAITEEEFDEAAGEKDACYHKVKSRYKVWPSAYASGALVKCRKVGASNWGNKSK